MAEIASAFVTIAPSAKGFGSKLNSDVSGGVRSAGSSLGKTFGKLFVLGASVIAAAGIGSFLKGSVDEAREAQKVGAQTNAVLKSTGQVANVSSTQIGKLATSLSNKIGVDDEAIQAGENMLLTFTNVRNEVGLGNNIFAQATATVQDMAAAFGGDAVSNSKILGKALNDPVKGVSALTRVGVSFTEKQKDQIKTLVESGHTLKAQKIILGELSKETKGSAEAQATAGDKFKVAFGNIKETIGTALLPLIDQAANAFVRFAPSIQSGLGQIGPLFKKLRNAVVPLVSEFVSALLPALKQVFGFFKANPKVLLVIGAALLAVVSPVAAVAVGLGALYAKSATFRKGFAQVVSILQEFGTKAAPVVRDVFNSLVAVIQTQVIPVVQRAAATFRTQILPAVASVVTFFATTLFPVLKQVVTIIGTQVIPILAKLAEWFITKVVPVIADVVQSVAHSLAPTFTQLANSFKTQILPTIQKLLAAFERARPTIQKVVLVVLKVLGAVIKFVAAVVGKVLPVIVKLNFFLIGLLVKASVLVIKAIIKVIGWVIDFGKKLFAAAESVQRFVTKVIGFFTKIAASVRQKISNVVSTVNGLPGRMLAALGNLGKILYDAGKKIVQGLIDGIKAMFGKLKDELGAVGSFIKSHKGPPSKDRVMLVPAGKLIMQGLIDGITSKKAALADALAKVGDEAAKSGAAAADKVGKKLKDQISKVRDSLATVTSDFASLVEPIASNFTQGLFDFADAASFTTNLSKVKGTLTTLLGNFKTLIADGLSPGFLYQLFQSGGPGLIAGLAGLPAADAVAAGSLFGDVTSLSDQLGSAVAGATDKGGALETQTAALTKKLDELIKHVDHSADRTGAAVNGAASNGHRRSR